MNDDFSPISLLGQEFFHMRQQAEITFETEETVVLRNSGMFLVAFCPLCREDVHMFRPETLALMTGSTERDFFRLLETGNIHFVETKRTYACPDCYRKSFNQSEKRQ